MADEKPKSFTAESPETKSKPAPRVAKKKSGAGRPTATQALAKQLEIMIDGVATPLLIFDPPAALIIQDNSEKVATAWANLAAVNPKVKTAIEKLMAGTAYSEVTFATLGMMIPLLAHYGLFPQGLTNPLSVFDGGTGQGENGSS